MKVQVLIFSAISVALGNCNPQGLLDSLPSLPPLQDLLPTPPIIPPLPPLSQLSQFLDPNLSSLIRSLPNQTAFLVELLNVTSSDIKSLVDDFNFRNITPGDIKFHLLVEVSPVIGKETTRHVDDVDISNPTKILIPGWKSRHNESFITNMSSNYHKRGKYNVVVVDWSDHATKNYHHAAQGTKHVGEIVGDFILKLTKGNLTMLKNVHLIGHSLGAHIAGVAGKRVREKSGEKVSRITALDAAAPLFEIPTKQPEEYRVNRNDADFVDGIHTNAGFLGVAEPLGHADFYVENGGPVQPGCFNLLNIIDTFACSHYKSNEYYIESIGKKQFVAVSCPSKDDYEALLCTRNRRAVMGEDVSNSASGTFYLKVDSPDP